MHKKQYIKVGIGMVLFTVILVFILVILVKNPIGIISNYETYKGNRDLLVGKIYVTEYVKEKYGFEPEITSVYPLTRAAGSELFPFRKYTGSVSCKCCVNGECFETVIRISDRAGSDNYQKEEIMDRIKTEVQKLEGLEYEYASYYSDLYGDDSNAHLYKAEEYYDGNADLKEFLKPLNFRMNLHSDVDLEEIDYDALCRMFPEERVYIYKPFPEGEEWDCYWPEQSLTLGDMKIRKYAPKLVGSVEVSACDASDFAVEEGIIQQGEWEGSSWIKFDPIEAPVYTCRFGEFKEVRLGLPKEWQEKEGIEIPEGAASYIYYQYRDETGKIRIKNLTAGFAERIYTDMLTIMYAKIEK